MRKFLFFIIICSAILGLSEHFILFGINELSYFTVLSNLYILLVYLYALFKPESNTYLRVKGGALSAIVVTFLVYNLILLPHTPVEKIFKLKNYTLHYIVPIFSFIEHIFYDRVKYMKKDPLLWSIFPAVYGIVSIIRGILLDEALEGLNSKFPYFFLDIYKLGYLGVLKYMLIVLIVYIIVAYIIILSIKIKKTRS